MVFEYIVKSAILLPQVTLEIELALNASKLEIKCKKTDKLSFSKQIENELDKLKKTYSFYTDKSLEITDYEGHFLAKIPLFEIE